MPPTYDAVDGVGLDGSALDAGAQVSHATSFDDLDLQDIVDPILLSPHIPYPPVAYNCAQQPSLPSFFSMRESVLPKPMLHGRSRTLGSIIPTIPGSPPRTKLPPVPNSRCAASQRSPISPQVQKHVWNTAEQVSSAHCVLPMSIESYSHDSVNRWLQMAKSPQSFLSMGSSSRESQGSAASEDGTSQVFYTAPASPCSLHKASDARKSNTKASAPRPYRHRRQSSSTSTLKMLFRRAPTQDVGSISDSETDSDNLPTPTDNIPRLTRHKRGSSFFKVLDRLKSNV